MDILTIFCNTIVILFETIAMVALVIGIYGFTGGEINVTWIKDIFNLLYAFPNDEDGDYE